jgi:hypothetical protein
MIQDIIVSLAVGCSRDPAVGFAISVAEEFDAELAGVAFCYQPVAIGSPMDAIPAELIESQRTESAKAAREAIARFKEATATVDLPAETRTVEAGLDDVPSTFGRLARTFDLAIVSQSEPDKAGPEERIIEAALFESGRPVIVVPYIQKGGLTLDRVLVCWDGSRTAARALADAMPLLECAKSVEIVAVGNGHEGDQAHFASVEKHLARHGWRQK